MNYNNAVIPIVIPLSKKKIIFIILGSLIFIVLGLWFVLAPDMKKYLTPAIAWVIGCSSLLIFGLSLAYGIIKFFDKKPGLVIDERGILDNSSGMAAGLIPWGMITFIKPMEIAQTKYLKVGVTDPEEVIARQRGFKKMLMKYNYKFSHTPVTVSANSLKIPFGELEKLLKSKWAQYKGLPAIEGELGGVKIQQPITYRLYTTAWIYAASYIGGPLAGFYLMSVNFKNLGNREQARKMILLGIVISLILFTVIVFIPEKIIDKIPHTLIPILYCILIGMYADIVQGTEIKEHIKSGGKKYSGWKTAAIGILSLAIVLGYIFSLKYIIQLPETKAFNEGVVYLDKESRESSDMAISRFNKVIKLNPNNALAYNNRGIAYGIKGEIDKAVVDFEKALKIDPNCVNAYIGLWHTGINKPNINPKQLLSYCNKALQINKAYADAYYCRAVTYFAIKEYDKSWDDIHKAEALGYKVNPEFLEELKRASESNKDFSSFSKEIDLEPFPGGPDKEETEHHPFAEAWREKRESAK